MIAASKVKKLDEQFEHFLDNVVIDVTDSELTPEKRAARRKLADKDEFEFCKIYFPSIFNEPWNNIHKHIKKLDKGNHAVAGSRNFGKTAFGLMGKLVRRIAIGGVGLVGIAMRTKELAFERTAALVRIMQRNKMLCYDYNIHFQQEKKGFYIINNTSFVGVSQEVGLRNFLDDEFNRFELLILDDLYNRLTVPSIKDNENVYNFVTSECFGQMDPNGLMLWFYNLISEGSPGSKFAEEFPKSFFNLPALNGKDKTNWDGHSLYTTKHLHHLRNTMPYEVWMGDWMNEPVLLGNIMDKDWLVPININLIKIIASLTAIDPAHGESPSACYKGMATLGITSDFTTVMIDIRIRKENYITTFDYIQTVRETAPHWKVLLFENDFNQFDIANPYYQQWQQMRKKHLPIFRFLAKSLDTEFYGTDKDSRIMNLVFPHQQGKFVYNETIMKSSDFRRYKSSYLGFGKEKKKLDGLDAAATAFIMLPRYIVTGSFKVLKERIYKNQEDSWLSTGTKYFRR